MNRTEFITATAIILFAAFVLGWFASWLIHRLTRPTKADIGELDRMAQEIHDAEEARDRALIRLEEVERDLGRKLAETEAELQAALDGLAESRTEVEELRDYIEAKLARQKAGI
ncbi:hypothetical protein MLD63_13195 [Paracoccus sp. TK19116]|uniref:Uncharacterized protein n=1 Tax=Paracoccus albicereus TaxID=2922394 RepID=A0ABT1MST2_9RHOB|nr:hypothetical protein [Paracoccus albicereus]MCQ0971377.1 hypothetical protein [Paracoccus albicereus]